MSSTVEKKTITNCDCPNGKGRDVIVITIETCCRRNCDGTDKEKNKHDDPSKVNFSEGHGDNESEAINSDQSSAEVEQPPTPPRPASSVHLTRTVSISPTGSVHSEHPEEEEEKQFKLPVLVGRHHGVGCAMEISVLEKHDDSCVFKKGPTDGRGLDDRSGSYECIGRMVFRTCNANELESDSSGSQGMKPGHGGASSTAITKPPPPKVMSSSSVYGPKSHHSQLKSPPASIHSVYGSTHSQIIEEPVTREHQEAVESARRRNKHRHNPQVMMVNTNAFPNASDFGTPPKKHFYGDDCKLHGPRAPIMLNKTPLLLPSGQFDNIYSSKKIFPKLPDESDHIENVGDDVSKKSKVSLETISSLTDLSKPPTKRKSSFLGSWFKRGSIKSPTNPESKRFKK